jgi:hypothetical protein
MTIILQLTYFNLPECLWTKDANSDLQAWVLCANVSGNMQQLLLQAYSSSSTPNLLNHTIKCL